MAWILSMDTLAAYLQSLTPGQLCLMVGLVWWLGCALAAGLRERDAR